MTFTKSSVLIAVIGCTLFSNAFARDLDNVDLGRMRDAARSYADAWLTSDADTVMATFVDEPVLSVGTLDDFLGQDAARAFWFPADSPPLKVTNFELTEIEAAGSGDLGYVRGIFRLGFEYDGSSYENPGKYVTILKKAPDGLWRITLHIRDDLPQED